MGKLIQKWINTFKRASRIDQIFLIIGPLLALPAFFEEKIAPLFPKYFKLWLDRHQSLVEGFNGGWLFVVAGLLFYAIWKIWWRTPPMPQDGVIHPSVTKGGVPWTESDGETFLRLGRDHEIGQLWGWVQDPQIPFIVIQAESGAGKTSLLRAGLQYLLTQKFDLLSPRQTTRTPCVYCELRPSDPVGDLLALVRAEWKTAAGENIPAPATLAELLEHGAVLPGRFVLLLDQFEQLDEEDPRHQPVFDFLCGLAARHPPCNLTCVVAYREEFASSWFKFCVRQLDAKNHRRPSPLILELFRRDDHESRSGAAVLATLAEKANIDLDTAEQPLLDAITDSRGRICPFDLSVAFHCLCQLPKRRLTAADIPPSGKQGLIANYLQGLLSDLPADERPVVFAVIYSELLEHGVAAGAAEFRRVAAGRTLAELLANHPIDENRLEYALNTLSQRKAGLLEALTAPDGVKRYRLLHERFITALRQLAGVILADASKARATLLYSFQSYTLARRWQRLLSGSDLRLVQAHWREIQYAEDAAEMKLFYERSLKLRTCWRFVFGGLAMCLVAAMYLIQAQKQADHWRDQLSNGRLPRDLYDVQYQLDNLTVTYGSLSDTRWMNARFNRLEGPGFILKSLSVFPLTLTNLNLVDCGLTEVSVRNLPALKSLNIYNNKLASLPELEGLPALTTLDLSQNSLTNLSGLERLPALTTLNLSQNGLTNLPGLERLPALAALDLSQNGLTNLPGLDRLPVLTALNLSQNGLTNLPGLERLSALSTLDLSQNALTNLPGLERLPALTALYLSQNGLTNLAGLEKLSALSTLDLGGNHLTCLSGLERLPALTALDLSGNNLTNLSGLEKLPALATLNLSGNSLTNLAGLGKLPALTTLDLSGNHLVNLSGLDNLPALATLNLSGNSLTNLADLEKLPALATLDLSQNHLTNLAGLEKLPALATLDLSGNHLTHLSGLEKLPALTSLDLNQNGLTNLSGLENLPALAALDLNLNGLKSLCGLEKLPSLTALDLNRNSLTNLSGLEKLPALAALSLSWNSLTNLSGLENLSALATLDLSQNDLTELSGLENLPALTTLDLRGNRLANLSGLEKLPALATLNLRDNDPADLSGLEQLPSLTSLVLDFDGKADFAFLAKLRLLNSLRVVGPAAKLLKGEKVNEVLKTLILDDNDLSIPDVFKAFPNCHALYVGCAPDGADSDFTVITNCPPGEIHIKNYTGELEPFPRQIRTLAIDSQ
jgi:internalin A